MRAQKTTKNREPEKQDEMKRWTRDQILTELLFSSHDLARDGYSRNSATSWLEIPDLFRLSNMAVNRSGAEKP
jgi:hypothetical protein